MNESVYNRQSSAADLPSGIVAGESQAENSFLRQALWSGPANADHDRGERPFVQASFGMPFGMLAALPAILSGGSIGLMPGGYPMGYGREQFMYPHRRGAYMVAPPGYQAYPPGVVAQPQYMVEAPRPVAQPATQPAVYDVQHNAAPPSLESVGYRGPVAQTFAHASASIAQVNSWCWDPQRGWQKTGAPVGFPTTRVPVDTDRGTTDEANTGVWAQVNGQWVQVAPTGYDATQQPPTTYDGVVDPNLLNTGVDVNGAPLANNYGLNPSYDYTNGYAYANGYGYDYGYGPYPGYPYSDGNGVLYGNNSRPVRPVTAINTHTSTGTASVSNATSQLPAQTSLTGQTGVGTKTNVPGTRATTQSLPPVVASRPAAPPAQSSEAANLRAQAEAQRLAAEAAQAKLRAAALARQQAEEAQKPKPKTT